MSNKYSDKFRILVAFITYNVKFVLLSLQFLTFFVVSILQNNDSMSNLSGTETEPFGKSELEERIPEQSETVQELAHKKTKFTNYFEHDPRSTKKTDKQAKCTLRTTKSTVLKMKNYGTSSLKRHLHYKHKNIFLKHCLIIFRDFFTKYIF